MFIKALATLQRWEDTIEKYGADKEYKIHKFPREREYNNLINQIDELAEDLINEVQEEIANKMKFGFVSVQAPRNRGKKNKTKKPRHRKKKVKKEQEEGA